MISRFLWFIVLLSCCAIGYAQPKMAFDQHLRIAASPMVSSASSQFSSARLGLSASSLGGDPFVGAGPSAALPAILVPGLGLKKTSGSSLFLGLAPICYGLVGAGIGGYVVYQQKYEAYHTATDQAEIDANYKSATSARKVFVFATSLGVGVWIAQIGLTLSQGIYNNHYRERAKIWKENAVSFAPSYDPQSKIAALNFHLQF